jgi:hypothetical protein
MNGHLDAWGVIAAGAVRIGQPARIHPDNLLSRHCRKRSRAAKFCFDQIVDIVKCCARRLHGHRENATYNLYCLRCGFNSNHTDGVFLIDWFPPCGEGDLPTP